MNNKKWLSIENDSMKDSYFFIIFIPNSRMLRILHLIRHLTMTGDESFSAEQKHTKQKQIKNSFNCENNHS